MGEPTKLPYQSTNPYRDLPEDPALRAVLRDVLYMRDVLAADLVPTSLPDEADYGTCSSMLRSLETRADLTWLVLHETKIKATIANVAGRALRSRLPVPEEPFDLTSRAQALGKHWSELASSSNPPERWEAAFDTTLVPALLAADSPSPSGSAPFEYSTPEQRQDAEADFEEWSADRAFAVSYFKLHPPRPMGFAPVPSRDGSARVAWDSLLGAGASIVGASVKMEALDGNPHFKPIYMDLDLNILDIPFGWEHPETKAKRPGSGRRMRRYAEREEKRKRQKKLLEELKELSTGQAREEGR